MQIQDNGKLTHSQKAPIPRPVLTFADTEGTLLAYCPACGEFALEIDKTDGQTLVKCSHCGFQSPSNHFTVQHRDAMHVPVTDYPLQRLITPQAPQQDVLEDVLEIKTASDWLREAAQTPPQQPLFDAFIYEKELSIFFGSANTGKSVLVMQLADALSKGARLQGTGIVFEMPKTPRKVLVCDFELNKKQFEARYSDNGANPYQFSPYLLRAEFNARTKIPKGTTFEQIVLNRIEQAVLKHGVEIVFVDNLTALCANATELKDAVELMRALKQIKEMYDISMCVVSHTPKIPPNQPILKTHLSGSMALMNLADSAFAVGESTQGSEFRYLKMVKTRGSEFKYGGENVVTCKMGKFAPNFLGFDFINFDEERCHLRQLSDSELDALEMNILTLHQNEPNLSYAEIAERLGTNKMKVSRVLRKFKGKS